MDQRDPEIRAGLRLLDDMDVKALSDEADQPHSVIAYDPYTESYSVTGPYPDGHSATLAAERLERDLNAAVQAPGHPPIRTWIALHFPPNA